MKQQNESNAKKELDLLVQRTGMTLEELRGVMSASDGSGPSRLGMSVEDFKKLSMTLESEKP